MSKLQDRYTTDVSVEEVLLDASNISSFNQERMEGKRELRITDRSLLLIWWMFLAIVGLFVYQLIQLQVVKGSDYLAIAENNQVDQSVIIAERGVVTDRRGEPMVWNELDVTGEYDFPIRAYTDRAGLGLGFGICQLSKAR